MNRCFSADGTPIHFRRYGGRRPLVLVHGTGGTGARWAPVLEGLGAFSSPVVMERRGRGESGDAPAHALAREVEDVLAVIDAQREPVDVLAHSFGALCALEAALASSRIGRLMLYEPPMPPAGSTVFPPGFIAGLEQMLAAGQREAVVTIFLREVVGMPAEELEVLRASPSWPERLAAAPTLPRELRAIQDYRFDAGRLGALRTPTLLLVGGESSAFFRQAIDTLAATLPVAQLEVLPGQKHVAMDTAPELFLATIRNFLQG